MTRAAVNSGSPWLKSARWDLTFLTGSAVLAAIPLSLFYLFGASTTVVNYLIAGLIGGPHLYSTFGYTIAEPSFRRRYGWLLFPVAVLPFLVAWLAYKNMTLLLTIFFFWASIHVLHQIAYIADVYRLKEGRARSQWNRLVDYGLIFTGLYPFASFKLIRGEFVVGGTHPLLVPEFARQPWIPWMVVVAFAFFLVAFLVKSYREHREGRLNVPSFTLISVTTAMSLAIPNFSNLDVAFQGYNTWHSFQYLALVWYMNSVRKERGQITNRVIGAVTGQGRHWAFYGMGLALTGLAVALIMVLFRGMGLDMQQSYYTVVLGSLLIHYYIDHIVFVRFGAVLPEMSRAELAGADLRLAAS